MLTKGWTEFWAWTILSSGDLSAAQSSLCLTWTTSRNKHNKKNVTYTGKHNAAEKGPLHHPEHSLKINLKKNLNLQQLGLPTLTSSAFLRRFNWRRRIYSDLTLRLHSSKLREGRKVEGCGLGFGGAAPALGAGATAAVSSMTLEKNRDLFINPTSLDTACSKASSAVELIKLIAVRCEEALSGE